MHSERQEEIKRKLTKMCKGKKGKLIIGYLPWEIHIYIEHVKLNDKENGIFTIRNLKSPTIIPMKVTEKIDYNKIKNNFENSWVLVEKNGKIEEIKNS